MDPVSPTCPHCQGENPDPKMKTAYLHQLIVPTWKQIVLFIIGLIGLNVVATIVQFGMEVTYTATHPGATVQDIANYLTEPTNLFIPNAIAYVSVGIALGLLLWKAWPAIFKPLKRWQPYVAALVAFVAVIVAEIVYSQFSGAVLKAMGIVPQSNTNQQGIVAMVKAVPAFSFIVFGLIGPFCEEVTYRVGLFGFLGRFNKVVAYLGTALIFGLIHFGWSAIWSPAYPGHFIVELINLPPYIGAGAVFCFIYDRWGFGAAFLAHATNNVFSVITSMIS